MICAHCKRLIYGLNYTEIFDKNYCDKCTQEIEEEFDLDTVNEKNRAFSHAVRTE